MKKKGNKIAAFEKDNLCVREQRFFLFNHEAYTRIIVIDLIIVKLFGVCLMVFPFKEKKFFT